MRLRDYVFGTGQTRIAQAERGGQPLQGNLLDAQEAQRDYGARGWAFDHTQGGFGGFGGFGGREFDATQEDPWTVDLWQDEEGTATIPVHRE
jgi:hypothetical protein